MHSGLRILVGGVPFGGDNVGDEAILECVVCMLRDLADNPAITVSTHAQFPTAEKLDVRTCPLYGFLPPNDFGDIENVIGEHDVFIWAGATGLSDYPEIPLELLRMAQEMGKKTVVWAVGMNTELNPSLYRIRRGKKYMLMKLCGALTLGCVDFVARDDLRHEDRVNEKLRRCLGAADLVVVRDEQSRDELVGRGVKRDIMVGADPAVELDPVPLDQVNLSDEFRAALVKPCRKAGVCVSAQREIQDKRNLVDYLDRLADHGVMPVLVPMNPVTDFALMSDLRRGMRRSSDAAILEGAYEPREVQAVVKTLDAVVSSRLHLLILASMAGVPPVGISRGSKLDNFLANFGLATVGDVASVDFDRLFSETLKAADGKEAFEKQSTPVRAKLTQRIDAAKERLRGLLRGEQ